MKKPFLIIASMLVPTIFLPAGVEAHPAQKAKTKHEAAVIFRPEDRRIIIDYFRVNTANLPPGLAKRGGNLPPGLQKQLRRNGHLPPGLQDQIRPFPVDLERQLPALPPIYRRGTIGDRAVIYDSVTRAILDVIRIVTGR